MPVGTGIALLGGRRNVIEQNQIYGNYTVGAAMVEGFLLEENPQARALEGNSVTGNSFGLGGTDLNGHDLATDGQRQRQLLRRQHRRRLDASGRRLHDRGLPVLGRQRVQRRGAAGARPRTSGEAAVPKWIKHPHAPKPGFEPLEIYEP